MKRRDLFVAVGAFVIVIVISLFYVPTLKKGLRFERRDIDPTIGNKRNTAWDIISHTLPGRVVFQAPDVMNQGQETKVTVRISANSSEDLTKGLKGAMPINDSIAVAPRMSVKLDGGDAFEIVPLTPENQLVATDTFTQWQFNVRALEAGDQELDVLVGLRVKMGSEDEESRFYPTYERMINVKVNRIYVVRHFLSENWKWLIATLILPALAFLIKKAVWP
jgi:hypothetical protein